MMISKVRFSPVGLSFFLGIVATDTVAAPLAIHDFMRDYIIYDVGAAQGRNSVSVPVEGTAAVGADVEVRLVREDGTAEAWVPVGQADATGRWSGDVAVAGDPYWYRVEVRQAASSETRQTTNRIGGGDVIAIMGQSELDRLFQTRRSNTAAPVLQENAQVQLTVGAVGDRAPEHYVVDNSDSTSASVRTMARMWQDNAPEGRKLHIVDLAESGTRHVELADDAQTDRHWSDLAETVGSVRMAGSDVGLVMESWFAGDRGVGENWEEAFTPFYTGLRADGSVFTQGDSQIARDDETYDIDHFLWDLSGQDRGIFDEDKTALGIFGPHRFDGGLDRINGTTLADGRVDGGALKIEESRVGVWDFLTNDHVAEITVDAVLPVPLDYANGFIDGDGNWEDRTHPSSLTPDGLPRLGQHVIAAGLLALGHVDFVTPTFDLVHWTPAYVEVGSSEGAITTARIARGLGPLGDGQPHWTDVLGFEVNGMAVTRAEIDENGMIRIYHPQGRLFTQDDVLNYGTGGASGFLTPVEDRDADAYLNIPIVDVGLVGLEGVAVLPQPSSGTFTNTLSDDTTAIPLPGTIWGVLAAFGSLYAVRRRQIAGA